MKFNTVILYDIENLLKGYGFSQKYMQSLSLKEIRKEIDSTKLIEKVAIQRAYANWSDPRLGFFKQEILELGIEPVQVFGFMYGQNKNAADIQLAIDAMELMHTRPALDIFVIVSGDGGFAALCKKLHEYGKTVIGCGYKKTTNKVFAAVSDHFIWVTDPEAELPKEEPVRVVPLPHDSRTLKIIRQLEPIHAHKTRREEQLLKLKEVIGIIEDDPDWQQDMKTGLSLAVVKEVFTGAILGFDMLKFGFTKFGEYLRYILCGTKLCLYSRPPSDVKLGLRAMPLPNYELLADLEARAIHSVECYRSILHTGAPIFKIPNLKDLKSICYLLESMPARNEGYAELVARLNQVLSASVTPEAIKGGLLSLIVANVFSRSAENLPLIEQRLSLTLPTAELMINHLFQQAMHKISTTIGEDIEENFFLDAIG